MLLCQSVWPSHSVRPLTPFKASTPLVVCRSMGLASQSRPTNPVLHAIFTLGAALGNEVWRIGGSLENELGGSPTVPTHALVVLVTRDFLLTWQMMFILFLPFLFWEYDITVARRLIVVWGATYYIGQGLKDLYVPTTYLL
jgi:hypothetical protein